MSDDFGAEFWAAVIDRATHMRARIGRVLDAEMARIDATSDDATVVAAHATRERDGSHGVPTVETDDDYLTPGEVAGYLHVSPKTILRWANDRRIPCIVTLGGHRRFRRQDVEAAARRMSRLAEGRSLRPRQVRLLERFSEECRQAVTGAQSEAGLLHHELIGDEHLLLGVMQDDEGVAARALASLGISLEATRRAVKETLRPDGPPTQSPAQFTAGAKRILGASFHEALQLGDSRISTEHLLLAMTGDVDSVAARTLLSLGADLEQLRHQVLQQASGDFFTVDETAQRLHVSPKTVTSWAKDGRIRHIETPDGKFRFHRSDIEAAIAPIAAEETPTCRLCRKRPQNLDAAVCDDCADFMDLCHEILEDETGVEFRPGGFDPPSEPTRRSTTNPDVA